VFFIGDGLTGTGIGNVQEFTIPTGATRLFLGPMDGFGWFNNSGVIDVILTTPQVSPPPTNNAPVPAPLWLLVPSLLLLVRLSRR
jgi:hypothetical protein